MSVPAPRLKYSAPSMPHGEASPKSAACRAIAPGTSILMGTCSFVMCMMVSFVGRCGEFGVASDRFDDTVVGRPRQQCLDLVEMARRNHVLGHVLVVCLQRGPLLEKHVFGGIVLAPVHLEGLTSFGLAAEVAALLQQRQQFFGVPLGRLEVDDDGHAHTARLLGSSTMGFATKVQSSAVVTDLCESTWTLHLQPKGHICEGCKGATASPPAGHRGGASEPRSPPPPR